jgi:hypothetical protein
MRMKTMVGAVLASVPIPALTIAPDVARRQRGARTAGVLQGHEPHEEAGHDLPGAG